MKKDGRNHAQLIIMLGAWVLGAAMLCVVVWELRRRGLEVNIW